MFSTTALRVRHVCNNKDRQKISWGAGRAIYTHIKGKPISKEKGERRSRKYRSSVEDALLMVLTHNVYSSTWPSLYKCSKGLELLCYSTTLRTHSTLISSLLFPFRLAKGQCDHPSNSPNRHAHLWVKFPRESYRLMPRWYWWSNSCSSVAELRHIGVISTEIPKMWPIVFLGSFRKSECFTVGCITGMNLELGCMFGASGDSKLGMIKFEQR